MKILTSDLRWVPAEKLKVGDKLLAFDEYPELGKTLEKRPGWHKAMYRKWRWSQIQDIRYELAECYWLKLGNGQNLYCTGDHKWLISRANGHVGWERTDNLKRSRGELKYHPLLKFLNIWDGNRDSKIGWLSGITDGEGCLVLNSGHRNPAVPMLIISQNSGKVLEHIRKHCEELGFDFADLISPSGCHQIKIHGGTPEIIHFLGQIRPVRLLSKFCESEVGQALKPIEYVPISEIEEIGLKRIIAIQTTTGTFVCEGFGAHNCYIYDAQFARLRSRMGEILPAWWQAAIQEVDPRLTLGDVLI